MKHGARPIKPSKMGNFRGSIPSEKCGTLINYESLLERDYITLLEFDPGIVFYESQPIKIPYMYKGAKHSYFPDFKVITDDNKIKIVEVKPERFLTTEKNLVKFMVGKQFCEENKWEFIVVSEPNIRIGFLQYNLKKIKNIDYHSLRSVTRMAVLELVRERREITIDTMVRELHQFNKQEIYSHVFFLIYKHMVYTDLVKSKISGASLIKILE
ncbi:TnsA endonuclease N-terminal domain-containing protein [Neobacillus terrae]|uniref:TnsA endonuclease N-terminal domain-containing protein n=1 Tax=Neobacillus terrae TaxID=3034837 RepID=UPI0014077A06|nr:TnsA endonuclease N-terminal domain-containing protein [Neobacillus terrae]NHM32435.1 hypothetical protein [Neobacillus terrae]